ncbi:MAG: hypothetical protein A2V74_05070 [Acidobacteria bacterium RBG_16_70_10]|nr:MAG: hypothetical protein A2V74_05070 [Acidobacteria bacterium RBG_16_70_10]
MSRGAIPGAAPRISGTVGPRPRLYCVVMTTGSARISARRRRSRLLRTTRSPPVIAGSSFSCRSMTTSAV